MFNKKIYLFCKLIYHIIILYKMNFLPETESNFYKTCIIVSDDTKIIALSDIHADIHSLIISLRDCAQVIRKKPHVPFDQNTIDPELETFLNVILTPETTQYEYPDDLNYEWVSTNTIVVIVGDIIDGGNRYRYDKSGILNSIDKRIPQKTLNEALVEEHYYPQIEIKILRFINALNTQAMIHINSRIYKLLGNHEIMNMLPNNFAKNYYFYSDKIINNYYNGVSRDDIFKYGNYGYNLIFQDGCGALLMINNYIFVHGQLTSLVGSVVTNYNYFNDINNNINSNDKTLFDKTLLELNKNSRHSSNNDNSQLWKRQYADEKIVSERSEEILKNSKGTTITDFKRAEINSKFCSTDLITDFKNFLNGSISTYRPDELKIVIGHCPQNYISGFNGRATSLSFIENQTPVNVTLTGPAINDKFNISQNLMFGITMECPCNDHEDDYQYKIYKLDIASSRSFDDKKVTDYIAKMDDKSIWPNIGTTNIDSEKLVLFTRTPQVLEIINNNAKIIKSQMKNTRIHQRRTTYENIIDSKPTSNLKLTNTANYLNKYLKYKNKYFKLKSQLNKK